MKDNQITLEFFQQYLGKNFQFRKGQLEIIKYIWNEYPVVHSNI